MRCGVVGIGLIGGSFALAARALGHEVWGHDASAKHVTTAVRLGLIDAAHPLEALAASCDIVVVAVPVDAVVAVCTELLDVPRGIATVVELSSTKEVLAKALAAHPQRPRLLLAHPMAGTEYSGPQAAVPDLFAGKTVVLCDTALTDADRLRQARALLMDMRMRCVEQASAPHDLHVAYVSHISHISSFALSLTVLEKERDERQIFDLASGGFASTVRLAKSNPATWTPIFQQNRDNVLDVLDEYINVLSRFRSALIKQNYDALRALMERANDIAPLLPDAADARVGAIAKPTTT